MEDALRIAVWHKYGLDKAHIKQCYHRLGARDQPLTMEEGRLLGLETVLKLSELRDRVKQGLACYTGAPAHQIGDLERNAAREVPTQQVKDLLCMAYLMDLDLT